ncbi:MAG: hypothetical protein ACYDBJ_15870 [Aggregatilineales bacterium]
MFEHDPKTKAHQKASRPAQIDQPLQSENGALSDTASIDGAAPIAGVEAAPRETSDPHRRVQRILEMQQRFGNTYTRQVIMREWAAQRKTAIDATQQAEQDIAQAVGEATQEAAEGVQRTVLTAGGSQTLYQSYAQGSENTPTQDFRPNVYSVTGSYNMTRNADTAANINVRIKFVSRTRMGIRDYSTSESEIPASDPRRQWATNMCTQLVQTWNSKYVLHSTLKTPPASGAGGTGTPPPTGAPPTTGTPPAAGGTVTPPAGTGTPPTPASPTEIRIPIVFSATPIFDMGTTGSDIHTVYLHDMAGNAHANQPIDAGNWYTSASASSYSAPLNSIYAHEYGHLLGLPDEYSRSNYQMHRIFHQLSTTQEVRMNQAVDRETMTRMALRAMAPALRRSFADVSQQIAAGFAGQRAIFEQQLAAGITAAWTDATLATTIRDRINPSAFSSDLRSGLSNSGSFWENIPLIGGLFRKESTLRTALQSRIQVAISAIDPVGLGAQVMAHELQAAVFANILNSALGNAINQVIGTAATIPFTDTQGNNAPLSVGIETAQTLENAETRGTSIVDSMNTFARSVTGEQSPAVGPGGTPLPQLAPSGTLTAQLAGLPASIPPASLTAWLAGMMTGPKMATQIRDQLVATLTANGGAIMGAANDTALAALLRNLVNNVSMSTSQNIVRGALSTWFAPTIQTAIQAVTPQLNAEADRLLSGSPPPMGAPTAVQASVTAIQTQMQTVLAQENQNAASQTSADNPANTSSAMETRVTVNALMGDNNASSGVRTDYMTGIKDQFNTNFRDANREELFDVRNA